MTIPRGENRGQFVRYLVAGAFNTGVTWLMFVALSQWLNYLLAYGIVFVVGVVLSFFLQSLWVFRSKLECSALLRFKAAYLINLAVGLLLLKLLVSNTPLSPAIAAIVVVALQVPLGFALSRISLLGPVQSINNIEKK